MNRTDLRAALENPNVRAFLRVIRQGESNQTDGAYTLINGGGYFSSYSDHPYPRRSTKLGGKAAGAYQFIPNTWGGLVDRYGFPDFSPASQDEGAVALIAGRDALDDVISGDITSALRKCGDEWICLPAMGETKALKLFNDFLEAEGRGQIATETPRPKVVPAEPVIPKKETKMAFPAIIAALLPTLLEKLGISKLSEFFKPGIPVSERNTQIGIQLFEVAKKTLEVTNEQAVIEKLDKEPEAVAALKQTVQDNWYSIVEAGGGGIAGASARDVAFMAASGGKWWAVFTSPSFLMALILVPLPYMIFGAIIGLYGKLTLSAEVTASIITGAITLVLGSVAGYYFGSTTTKNKPNP